MKKGRVGVMTRPQPTIFGNCDSWSFIVGKKGGTKVVAHKFSMRCNVATKNHQQVIHKSPIKLIDDFVDTLWVFYG
ncbi:hypothetical protein [Ottowia sp.]|uniref:hypothetical protein n=1 Tax=Ottowia sp. TaxID=1898956 RepID=UPI003A8B7BDC